MSDEDAQLLHQSRIYQEYLAERKAILDHKWFMSEHAKHDVGIEKAILDWIIRYRGKWRSDRRAAMGLPV